MGPGRKGDIWDKIWTSGTQENGRVQNTKILKHEHRHNQLRASEGEMLFPIPSFYS
jgi:hypothetical protein